MNRCTYYLSFSFMHFNAASHSLRKAMLIVLSLELNEFFGNGHSLVGPTIQETATLFALCVFVIAFEMGHETFSLSASNLSLHSDLRCASILPLNSLNSHSHRPRHRDLGCLKRNIPPFYAATNVRHLSPLRCYPFLQRHSE